MRVTINDDVPNDDDDLEDLVAAAGLAAPPGPGWPTASTCGDGQARQDGLPEGGNNGNSLKRRYPEGHAANTGISTLISRRRALDCAAQTPAGNYVV